jgi:hypothetical protein
VVPSHRISPLLVAVTCSLGQVDVPAAKGGSNHKPALHRADCTTLATSPEAVGFAILQMDSAGDLQVEISVKQGMARTDYKAYLRAAPCQVVFTGDIVTTNKKGKGNIHMMVPTASIPAGVKLAVQLVSPPSATVPGPGPFTDVITSDFVTPASGE